MTERREYCIEDCCDDPQNPGFPRPTWGHGERCEAHTKQWTRNGRCTPIQEKLSPKARFLEACIRLTEAEEDGDHNSALRTAWDIPKQEALKNLTDKEIEKLARQMLSKKAKASLARARREGRRIGRKPKQLNPEVVRVALRGAKGSINGAAKLLGVHRRLVRRMLGPKGGVLAQPPSTPSTT